MIVNASIQVIPLTERSNAYGLIDTCIGMIQKSGIKYTVSSFSTELEGEFKPVQELVNNLTDYCYNQKDVQFLIYTRWHICGGKDIIGEDKTAKFNQ